MNKILKRILIGLGALIMLLIIGVAVLFIVIDPNDYRDEISAMAYKATGRKIELNGDIGLKVIPRLAFSIKDVSVEQDTSFGEGWLAHVDELGLSMALFPLLGGRIEVQAVNLKGLTLNVIENAQGHYNFEVITSAGDSQVAQPAPADSLQNVPAAPRPSGSADEHISVTADAEEARQRMEKLVQSRIDSVEISNCVINYLNQGTKEAAIVRINRLSLGNVGLNRDITCLLDVAAEVGKDTKAGLILDGQARYELNDRLITFNFKSFAINAEAPQLQGKQEVKGNLSGSLDGKAEAVQAKLGLNSSFMNGGADVVLSKENMQGNVDIKSSPVTLLNALSPAMKKQLNLPPELMDAKGPLRSLDLKLAFNMTGKTLNVSTAEVRLGGSDLVASIPSVKGVMNDAGGLASAEGSLSVKGTLRPVLPLAGINPKGNAFSKLDSSLSFRLAGDNLTLTALKLKIDDTLADLAVNRVDIRLAPAGPLLPINSAKADLTLAAKPRQLMDALDIKIDTADPKVLADLTVSMNLAVDNTSLKLTNLKGQLDETSISALVELLLPGARGIPKGSTSYTKADLQIGSINIDRYLPPESTVAPKAEQPATQTGQPGKPGTTKVGGPLKETVLEKANAQFTAGIKNLTVKKVPVQNITLNCTLVNGLFTVSQAALSSFEGQFNLSAKADLVNAGGAGALKASFKGLNLGSALVTVLDEKRLSGKADMNMDFTFKGLDTESILATLNGKGDLKIRDGVLKDFQLIPADAPELLLKHRLSDYHFSDLGGSFTVVNGKLTNNDLGYKDKNVSLSGKGSIMLVNRNVDYTGVLKTKETGEIPLRVQGPLSNLKITLDQEALAKMALDKAKEKAVEDLQKKGIIPEGSTSEERRDNIRKDINDKVGKEIERGLQNIFNK